MTLDQLKTFLWVARLGGLRRAAEQMNVSQPAISARISGLEMSLGTQLFERTSAGVTLTKRGYLLRNHAEQIALCLERIKAEVVPPDGVDSLLRLGVAETVAQSWLPEFLSELRQSHPKLSIEVTVDISLHLREMLLSRALDLAILMGPVSEYSVDNVELPAYELSWFRPPEITEPDLSVTPVITYNRNSRPYRELQQELMLKYGGAARIFPSNSLSTGFEMVAAGIGVGILPRALARHMLETGRIIEFDPGWQPEALNFTASFIGEPRDELAARAAGIARDVARTFQSEKAV
ncbi:MAG: LysR family transcriptional regulator [Stappiaceae bacterium]